MIPDELNQLTPDELNELIAKVYSESDGKADVLHVTPDSPLLKAIESGEFEDTLETLEAGEHLGISGQGVHSWMDEPLIDPNLN